MVTMRSPGSMSCDSAFSNVVLPEPVPPEIRMLRRLREAIFSTVAMGGEMLFCWVITSSVMPFLEHLRIEIDGKSVVEGKGVYVRVGRGGRSTMIKKKKKA